MRKEYKTVFNCASVEMEEKKSRFISSVKPASSEEEALDFIHSLKSRYRDATHNVYAYFIGGENTVQRFSDDGEPSGTAGMPVLEVIKRMEVQDLVVVVTRYFGGTLLGAAGLIRAYGKSAALGIEAAAVVCKKLCMEASVVMEYGMLGKLQSVIAGKGYAIKNVIYGQDVEIIVFVPVEDVLKFTLLINEASNGKAIVEMGEKTYVALDGEGKPVKPDRNR
ncbi:MAG: YigZ family protein [Clostridiales bacterium]|nr:YigZ family protein [Eubacteriales bacterium]MDH7566486.1 YigZ family protein [Clostridiales bacterium]